MYENHKFNLGRDALKYAVTNFGIKQMHIPYYLCDVIRHTLVEIGCKPIFYHIDDNFFPTKEFCDEDYILYPNYWGVFSSNVKLLSKKYSNLIVDNAHAYYNLPSGLITFNAGHKFGYKKSDLWIKNQISDCLDSKNTELFYKKSKSKINIRKNKFLNIHKKYGQTNLLKIDINSIPFVYPYLANSESEADNLVKFLKENGKTVYRYWSPLPKSFNEYKFYSRLVPIPILPPLS